MSRSVSDDDVRLSDLNTLLVVRRRNSLTAAARELGVTTSQVSKSIARLERHLGAALLERSSTGIAPSEALRAIEPHAETMVSCWHALLREPIGTSKDLTIAAPSYLNVAFVPAIAAALGDQRIRAVDLHPALIRAFAGERLFDVMLGAGDATLPKNWVSEEVGRLRLGLFASPELATKLGRQPVTADVVREHPFVSPVYGIDGRLVPTDDGCPIGRRERRIGHEVATIQLALAVAARTQQLVFGPVMAAESYVARNQLVEIAVDGWHVAKPLQFACNGDRVLKKTQRLALASMRAQLAAQ